jgi:RNA polymerase sigma-70 factor (ECF subfamily)
MVDGPDAALGELVLLEDDGRLAGYRYLHATKADLLNRLGQREDAAKAYRDALALTDNDAEREFLAGRIADPTRVDAG